MYLGYVCVFSCLCVGNVYIHVQGVHIPLCLFIYVCSCMWECSCSPGRYSCSCVCMVMFMWGKFIFMCEDAHVHLCEVGLSSCVRIFMFACVRQCSCSCSWLCLCRLHVSMWVCVLVYVHMCEYESVS